MVCFQHAGGSARHFPWLNAAIPPPGELPCVQYPEWRGRWHEVSIEEFTDMLDTATEVPCKGPRAPLVLFGHRLGGLIGFEAAQAPQDGARPVLTLIVSGHRAPSV